MKTKHRSFFCLELKFWCETFVLQLSAQMCLWKTKKQIEHRDAVKATSRQQEAELFSDLFLQSRKSQKNPKSSRAFLYSCSSSAHESWSCIKHAECLNRRCSSMFVFKGASRRNPSSNVEEMMCRVKRQRWRCVPAVCCLVSHSHFYFK